MFKKTLGCTHCAFANAIFWGGEVAWTEWNSDAISVRNWTWEGVCIYYHVWKKEQECLKDETTRFLWQTRCLFILLWHFLPSPHLLASLLWIDMKCIDAKSCNWEGSTSWKVSDLWSCNNLNSGDENVSGQEWINYFLCSHSIEISSNPLDETLKAPSSVEE